MQRICPAPLVALLLSHCSSIRLINTVICMHAESTGCTAARPTNVHQAQVALSRMLRLPGQVCYSDPGMSNANMQFAVVRVDASAPENAAVSPELEARSPFMLTCERTSAYTSVHWQEPEVHPVMRSASSPEVEAHPRRQTCMRPWRHNRAGGLAQARLR